MKKLLFNLKYLQPAIYLSVLIAALGYGFTQTRPATGDLRRQAIDRALFDETEFFGSTAFVPFTAATARENLAKVALEYPGDREILLKIAGFDESLGRDDDAESILTATGDLSLLAAFYHRRGNFPKQAATLAELFTVARVSDREVLLKELFEVARRHDLRDYLGDEFSERIAEENAGDVSVFAELIAAARTNNNPALALRLLDRYRERFDSIAEFVLIQKVEILTETGRLADAEKAFVDGFEPFWSDATSKFFYDFLRTNERLRAYRSGLRRDFRADPSDFSLAMRLFHLENADGNEVGNIVDALESTRRRRKVAWTADELVTVSQLLVTGIDAERAARFLYTLSLQNSLRDEAETRRRVLYQLFQIVVLADENSLALSSGDLGFFEATATADARPGIATGVLSLIFSDAPMREDFDDKQRIAARLFNRAAAHRIFDEFRAEFPDSPQLAQMYVDLIRHHTKARNLEIARGLLVEFDQTKLGFKDFPDAAVKLAEGFFTVGDFAREREVYTLLLDHLGKSTAPKFPLRGAESAGGQIFYAGILERLIASFTREKMRDAIGSLYAAELTKYPEEPILAENFAAWLAANGRNAEVESIYRRALARFPEKTWKDRFARWLIAEKRSDEFAAYAGAVIESFDDTETRDFLAQFIDSRSLSNTSADGRLYAAMYAVANRRFPRNIGFVKGLLRFYRENKLDGEWLKLSGRYFFESTEIRSMFLDDLAKRGTLRSFFDDAKDRSSAAYGLFRAEAATRLSDFETALGEFNILAAGYPQYPEFAETNIALARSLGQTNRAVMFEAALLSTRQSDRQPADATAATRAGEIYAELGDYETARRFWHRIRETATGEDDAHLETAAVFWDYFQYDEALAAILTLRLKRADPSLFAFEAGAIYESKRNRAAATEEYLKVLEAPADEASRRRAMDRLGEIVSRGREDLDDSFERQKAVSVDPFRLSFNYSDVFFRAGDRDKAVKIVIERVRVEKSTENLRGARNFFRYIGETEALRETLQRIAETAENPRDAIAGRLRLAESHREAGEVRLATAAIDRLLRDYPANLGVVKEAESFYWEMGRHDKSLAVLRAARLRATGKHRYRFERKLAVRLVSRDQTDEAIGILGALAARDPLDGEVFEELSDLYARADQPLALKDLLDRNIAAFKRRNPSPREFESFVNERRRSAVSALTRLKRFDLATAQYVEMINLAPDDEEILDSALAYSERYGGTDSLIEYYEKTARENYKNYRWNVVLARLYAARGDLGKAAANYRTAIFNQPEMTELHESLAEIHIQSGDFAAALASLDKVVELAGEDEKLIRRRAFVLEKLGRKEDAAKELAKLPAPTTPSTVNEQFREAATMPDQQTAAEKFREAFARLLTEPAAADLKSTDITEFFRATKRNESFRSAVEPLWKLRDKLKAIASDESSSENARARRNLKTLDAAFAETVAAAIRTTATGTEIAEFRGDLGQRLAANERHDDSRFLLSVVVGCGFADLEERFHLGALTETRDDNALRALVSFYRRRGDFKRISEVLTPQIETRPDEFVRNFAENSRILGSSDGELKALRILSKRKALEPASQERFFTLLYANDRAEFESLTEVAAEYSPALIRFLLTKGEFALAIKGVRNSSMPRADKLRAIARINRFAGISDEGAEAVFEESKPNASIGTLIENGGENPLVPPDWLRLAGDYADFLNFAGRRDGAARFSMAQPEFAPRDAARQFAVGYEFHLRGDFARAAEHYEIALKLTDRADEYLPYAGAARFGLGQTEKAFEHWSRLIASDAPKSSTALYVRTLNEFGLGEKARADVRGRVVAILKSRDSDVKSVTSIILELAKTIAGDAERAEFFRDLAAEAPRDRSLASAVIDEKLVSPANLGGFYELLIERSAAFSGYEADYRFKEFVRDAFDQRLAETVYDLRADFAPDEPESERLAAQQNYLTFLIEHRDFERDFERAAKVVRDIDDSLTGKYARPVWLRLADWRIRLVRGDDARVFGELLRFTAVSLPDINEIAVLPNLERLNATEKLLAKTDKASLRNDLREAFYARLLAVEQFESTNFLELARIRFARGDNETGLRILKALAAMPSPEAKAQLVAIPLIDAFADRNRLAFEESTRILGNDRLAAAAELAAEFGEQEFAANLRREFVAVAPDDRQNLIELARLEARLGRYESSAKLIAEISADRVATRRDRWQATLAGEEIAAEDSSVREVFDRAFSETTSVDTELTAARKALRGEPTEGVDESPETRFLRCAVAREAYRPAPCLIESASVSSSVAETFGAFATHPLLAVIEDQLRAGAESNAVATAKSANFPGGFKAVWESSADRNRYPTLKKRAVLRLSDDLQRILPALSFAAERTGDLAFAIELETARLGSFSESVEVNHRLEVLRARLAEEQSAAARLPRF